MKHTIQFFCKLLSVTVLCGIVYVAVQQNYRQSANDPQIQMSEDIAAALALGADPASVVGTAKVDIANSLAPFVSVYGENGALIASSALLNGETPQIPAGILEYVRTNGEDRVTWQPKSGVRQAIVVSHVQGKSSGFVVVGRSLREVERREGELTQMVGVAWLFVMILELFHHSFLVAKKGKE